jgi:toxin ParE1/3/4
VTVQWTPSAQQELDDQLEYIALDKPSAAQHMADRIQQTVLILANLPRIGVAEGEATRRFAIPRTPFVIYYRIVGDTVRIFSLLHGAQHRSDR